MDAAEPLRATLLRLIQTAHTAAGRPSIRQLERETGVSNSVISRALTGERVPSRSAFLALAEALGADPQEWRRLWDANDAERNAGRSSERAQLLAAVTPRSGTRGRIDPYLRGRGVRAALRRQRSLLGSLPALVAHHRCSQADVGAQPRRIRPGHSPAE